MDARVVVLGAGFGGLEVAALLSHALGDRLDLTLVDRSDAFVFGGSKLDLLAGRRNPDAVRLPYRDLARPGVRFRHETVTAIDPVARRVTTDAATYEADVLVVALGADYDPGATPGLTEGGNEFYSVEGAVRAGSALAHIERGHVVVGATGNLFKCPPAPSEAALLVHEHLTSRGVRDACEISLVLPTELPIPPSHESSQALIADFDECGVRYVPGRVVRALDPGRRTVVLSDASELHYDLFLGIPRHRAPEVVVACGMTEDGWIPVDRGNLTTCYPGVYAIGDVTSVGTAKAGVYAESAARVVAAAILADYEGGPPPPPWKGQGGCFLEFSGGRIGRVDVDFFAGPGPSDHYTPPSPEIARDRQEFAIQRRERWFGA
jgi:sulfide:quinone oxidoreductase